jgi:hypothetical protein
MKLLSEYGVSCQAISTVDKKKRFLAVQSTFRIALGRFAASLPIRVSSGEAKMSSGRNAASVGMPNPGHPQHPNSECQG